MRIELPEESVLLRIFISELDRYHHQPLYEALVLKAREVGLAGATVLRGPLGYGHTSRLHTAKILRLSDDLPLVVEIVETQAEDRRLPAGARRDDGKRPRHHREGSRAALRPQPEEAADHIGRARGNRRRRRRKTTKTQRRCP